MRYKDIKEGVGRITKQNQTVDVGPSEIKTQAAKFGNSVDKDGRPPTLSKKTKGKSTNVLFNLGLAESISVDTLYENVLYYRQMKEDLGEIAQATEIYIDMDGVLADFFGEWAKLMDKKHWTKIDDFPNALQKIRDTEQFWLELPILPQAKQLLALVKQVKGEYNICSTPLADDPKSEPHKREWIKKNLAFFPPKNIHITHDKPQYATQQDGTPNILIDDYGKNVEAWDAAGGTGFKYKDHKFERTAKDIKQHMQEPVEDVKENITSADIPVVTYDRNYGGDVNKVLAVKRDAKADAEALYKKLGGVSDANFEVISQAAEQKKQELRQVYRDALAKQGIKGAAALKSPEYLLFRKQNADLQIMLGTAMSMAGNGSGKILKPNGKIIKPGEGIDENFADGKKKGKSRPGRVKKSGASCNGSVTSLRKKAKNASGEKAKMYHWCANMKSGRK